MGVGEAVGLFGCALAGRVDCWNLYYWFRPEVHGHGLATELCNAAVAAAHRVGPHRPVIAYLLEHNAASRATAERAGLTLQWRGPDAGNPDPQAVRLIYADRPLTEDQLSSLVAST